MSRRAYLAGPMTGLPDFNYPAFHKAAAALRAEGLHVENPAENPPPDPPTWENWMRLGIKQLVTCDEIVVLPNWELSRGVEMELGIASALGMPIRWIDADDPDPVFAETHQKA